MKTSGIKIMSTKPEVSDEELREYMNFEELLERRNAVVRKKKTNDLLWKSGILSTAVITLAIVWFLYRGGTGEEQVAPEMNSDHAVMPGAAEPGTPVTEHDSAQFRISQDVPSPATSESEKASAAAEPSNARHNEAPDKKPEVNTNSETGKENSREEYQYAEAEPVDGFPALYEYFNKELVYPQEAMSDSIQGVVTCSFVIGITGAPENIRIQNSLGEAFDNEVRRLIEGMPAWKPATVNGKPVPSRLSIPVTFRLEKVSH